MPELPEVETVKRGLIPHLQNATILRITVRQGQLRWPVPTQLPSLLAQQLIVELSRRGKYLLVHTKGGTLIIHLGMSGSLRVLDAQTQPNRHDHVDIVLSNQKIIRYNDPRRFGAILFTEGDPLQHPLIKSIGVEPLSTDFTGEYLKQRALKHRIAIKTFIMNSHVVAGIGNIYAQEALFISRIHPETPANELSLPQCEHLVAAIQKVLSFAIDAGGTTLKDFVTTEGKPGYFSQQLFVYGRNQLPCKDCGTLLQSIRLGQRSTVFCPACQSTGSIRPNQ